MPLLDRPLPENGAVERIAREQRPLRRHLDGPARTEVHDVEDPAAGRDHRAQSGQVVVMAQVIRRTDPLIMLRRPDHGVLRDRVVIRAVQVVRPVVDLLRPRLHQFWILDFGFRIEEDRDAAGAEHAQDFFLVN